MEDLPDLVASANNWEVARWLTDKFPHPYTEADGVAFLTNATQNPHPTLFAIEKAGRAIGSIGYFRRDDIRAGTAEFGYFLAEPYWGQGIMTQAIRDLLRIGFEEGGLERMEARPFSRNYASRKILIKAGLRLEGLLKNAVFKLGEWDDECIYGIVRGDWDKNPK